MKRSPFIHLFIAALVLGASVLLYLFWYSFVETTSAQAVALQNELLAKETEAGRAAAARDALGIFTSDGSATNSHFVAEKDVVPFLEQVQKIGSDIGTTISVVSVAADSNTIDPSIRLSLSITGTFDTVLRTLGNLEHSTYAMRTEMFDMKTTGSGAWTATAIFLVSTPLAATTTPSTP